MLLFFESILRRNQLILSKLKLFFWVALFGLAACAVNNDRENTKQDDDFEQQKVSIDLINDIPIPDGARLDTAASLILGRGDRWTGRMVINVASEPAQMFALYQSQMPSYGWQVILSVQDRSSNIVFVRGDRIASLFIKPLGLRGARITMVTSLKPVEVPSAGTFNAAPTDSSNIGSGINSTVPLQ